MAIISEVEGLEVTILVNGRDAKEYEDPKLEVLRATNSDTDAGNRPSSTTAVCVKYIEAYPGDFFAIHFKKHNQFLTTSREISCRVEADGRLIRELPWSLKLLRYPLSFGDICTKTTSGKFASLQLQFGKLEIVPDQDCSPEKLFIDALQAHAYGTIRVHFLHIHDALRAGQVLDDCIPQAPTTVAEKYCAGKALSVSTQCTVSSTYPYRSLGRRHGYINHDPLQRPLATIEFRCRSQAGLVQEGIIRQQEVIDSMTEEELRQAWKQEVDNMTEKDLRQAWKQDIDNMTEKELQRSGSIISGISASNLLGYKGAKRQAEDSAEGPSTKKARSKQQ